MSKHAAEAAVPQIAESLRALLFCSQPRPGEDLKETAMSGILGDLGTRIFTYAKGLEGDKARVLAHVLSAAACCIAGMPEGVSQQDCQQFSGELMHQLVTVVAPHMRHEDEKPILRDDDVDPLNN